MQVWPVLTSLPVISRVAASSSAQSASRIAGDLPPSSSVTGVRLAAAASATSRPTAVDPVKSRWSNGSATKARATAASPVTTASSSAAKRSATARCNSAAQRGVTSDTLTIARLPAASAATAGPIAS